MINADMGTSIPVDYSFAIAALVEVLGAERMRQLAELLADVITDTGYGDVKIVVVDGRIGLLKAEKSYK